MKVSLAVSLSLAAVLSAGMAMAAGAGPGDGSGRAGDGAGMSGGMGQERGVRGLGCTGRPWSGPLGLRGGRWWNDPAMIEKLKLTDDQRKAMDTILLDHREKLIDMRAAVEKAELEMEPLVQDDSAQRRPNPGANR